ncbi:KEOPS complex subunit Cgi121 [Halobacteriaceae archaeon GCM10025711]
MRLVEGVADVTDVDAFVARLSGIGDEFGCAVQAFDARLVAGEDHLATAVEHANRSFARGENVARDRAVEVLLYAAGRRQIDQALALGVEAGETPAVVVVDGEDEAGAADAVRELLTPAATLGEAADEGDIGEYFGVTDAERSATTADLQTLVCERVALLDVEK